MALARRRRPGPDQDRTVPPDLDRAVFRGCPSAGHLHIRAEPDAEQPAVAAGPSVSLFPAQLAVACELERAVQRRLVLAAVVGAAARGRERERFGPQQVEPPELCRVGAELEREHVHRPLDQRRRLRAPGAPIGGDDRSVGDDAEGGEVDLRDVIDARGHHPREGGQPRP